jgi:hypothetical protein
MQVNKAGHLTAHVSVNAASMGYAIAAACWNSMFQHTSAVVFSKALDLQHGTACWIFAVLQHIPPS